MHGQALVPPLEVVDQVVQSLEKCLFDVSCGLKGEEERGVRTQSSREQRSSVMMKITA